MANVKKEKWFEMWGEMTRFFDLVRWGDAETELKDHYTTLPVFFGYKEGKSGADLNADGSNFDQVYNIRYFDVKSYTGVTYSFQKGKCEYFPFPSTEIANNPELKQNPGW
jgi:SusD family.